MHRFTHSGVTRRRKAGGGQKHFSLKVKSKKTIAAALKRCEWGLYSHIVKYFFNLLCYIEFLLKLHWQGGLGLHPQKNFTEIGTKLQNWAILGTFRHVNDIYKCCRNMRVDGIYVIHVCIIW